MEKAIISLSFDDGRKDNYEVFRNITSPRNIPVTLNVITGYIDGSYPTESWPSGKEPLTMKQLSELSSNSLIEIALHGDTHQNTEADVKAGRDKLVEWIGSPEGGKWGFASPFSALPVADFVSSSAPEFFRNDILYMRTGLKVRHPSLVPRLCGRAAMILPLTVLYKTAYEGIIMDHCEDRVLYSFPITKYTSFARVKGFIDSTIRCKGALTLMLHSIDDDTTNSDEWSWSKEDFKNLCNYLYKKRDAGKVELMTSRDLYEKLSRN